MAAHSAIAQQAKVSAGVIQALRSGQPVPDAKLQALREFTATIVSKRGRPSERDLEAFYAAGYTRRHVLDVVVGVAMKRPFGCRVSVVVQNLSGRSATVWAGP